MALTLQAATKPWPAGPRGRPYFGHLGELRRDRLGFLTRLAREYGDFVPMKVKTKDAVLVSDPALIEEMLFARAADFSKNNLSDFFHPALRKLLLFEESSSWLEQRRLAQPALRPDRMPAYARIMAERTEHLCDGWKDGQVLDVTAAMRTLTLDILSRTLFDFDLAEIAEEAPAIFDAILEDVGARAFSPIYLSFLPTGSNLRSRARFKRAQELVNELIATRRREADGRGDLLSVLIRHRTADGRALTDDEVKLTLIPLAFAGHETTAMALSWSLHLLAGHHEAQRRLRAEVRSVVDGRLVTGDDVPRLPFTAGVLHETLRLYPPIWGFGREAVRDTELGKFAIPAGTTIFASQWVLHRDARYFADPDGFNPDRWAGGLASRLPRCAFMPFGVGPRRCLGSTFAVLEAVIALATVCARYELVPAGQSSPALEPLITLRAKNLYVKVAAAR
ncbi:MAG TPA: cytochrome P450 [Candidatus Dormibacteraeota bacterium]|nr:cytochrome P450 [Candidatus Dormibacteraeota bacterium]